MNIFALIVGIVLMPLRQLRNEILQYVPIAGQGQINKYQPVILLLAGESKKPVITGSVQEMNMKGIYRRKK